MVSTTLSRRDFLKYAGGGLAVIVVGSKLSFLGRGQPVMAATQTITFRVQDAIKDMHTHNSINSAQSYFWVYKSQTPLYPAEVPGPVIMAARGDVINISVTNDLDEPHTLSCPTLGVTSAPIAPGQTALISIPANVSGCHLYYDHLNAPVNRMMGLHGAIMVMPSEADRLAGHKLTPYSSAAAPLAADHGVQRLYDDFGSAHFPGLAWEEGDARTWALYDPALDGPTPVPVCTPFRSYLWLLHQVSPKLFAEVGNLPAGQLYDPTQFMNAFLRDPFQPHAYHSDNQGGNRIPSYFTINGQSGHFSHFSPYVTMMGRVGEPAVVHIMNAGLWAHSMHLHANHMWITSVNGVVNPNPIWVDVFRVDPMDRVDYTVPFMRPPDVGHAKGVGPYSLSEQILQSDNGHPLWPPIEEFNVHIPPLGTLAKRPDGTTCELGQRLSPLCYPMHDHSEPSQTSQGGNYNTGLISGIYFTGDRHGAGPTGPGVEDFPMDEDFHMAYKNARGCVVTERAAPPIGEIH